MLVVGERNVGAAIACDTVRSMRQRVPKPASMRARMPARCAEGKGTCAVSHGIGKQLLAGLVVAVQQHGLGAGLQALVHPLAAQGQHRILRQNLPHLRRQLRMRLVDSRSGSAP